ncbi:hypothetical protein PN36_02425 [Candidatus Thiomargarita nelsonii]|uniref:Uncharacterized protein n=1 Tax=Candidatus Thiomargarita nelsonii TaxID=1003181 RepID=A0A4E0QWK1_9GAMM|nr:hypothetical protein PN36_02425 [Candidatus Thiomargarita nelsonii]
MAETISKKNHFWGERSLVILSITLSLLLAEAIIRIFLPQPLSGTWRVNSEKGYMLNKSGGTARHQKGSRVVQYRFNELHLRGEQFNQTFQRSLLWVIHIPLVGY